MHPNPVDQAPPGAPQCRRAFDGLTARLRRALVRDHRHPGTERDVRRDPGDHLLGGAPRCSPWSGTQQVSTSRWCSSHSASARCSSDRSSRTTRSKFVGAVYLVWIGVQTIRHRRGLAEVTDAVEIRRHRSILFDGFVVGLANPKTIVFFAAILPQYVRTDGTPAALQMAVLGVIFVLVALASDSMWALATGTARSWLTGSPRRLERLTGVGGLRDRRARREPRPQQTIDLIAHSVGATCRPRRPSVSPLRVVDR